MGKILLTPFSATCIDLFPAETILTSQLFQPDSCFALRIRPLLDFADIVLGCAVQNVASPKPSQGFIVS